VFFHTLLKVLEYWILLLSGRRGKQQMFSVITQCETLIQNRDKFHALDRSNFRSKDWAEVSKIVNATCRNDEKAPKTQEQCRMKVDSLKKRYRQVCTWSSKFFTWIYFSEQRVASSLNDLSLFSLALRITGQLTSLC
jgi:hypothetical protein